MTAVEKVATLLSWQDIEEIEYLEIIVPMLIEVAEEKTNTIYDPENLPGGVVLFVAKAAEYFKQVAGVTQERLGDYSYTMSQDIPKNILAYLPRTKVRFF